MKPSGDGEFDSIRLGLGTNIRQFLALVLVNAFVGAMIGLEQTVVPLMGKEEIGIEFGFKDVFVETSWKNRTLLAVSQAGLVNNLIFGVTWGLFTLYFASIGMGTNEIGFLKALHPGIWGVLQLLTGTFSDRVGRKILIYPGMIIQGIGIWVVFIQVYSIGDGLLECLYSV